ncbi:PAN domain protein, partial [Ostertagia ostertagi]
MHNNTALDGVDPIEMIQVNAGECQKKCVDLYPSCSAVVYYYLDGEKKHHQCYLFGVNSLSEEVHLVRQTTEQLRDVVRMLEIVANCHAFDDSPPLEEDGLVSSTDKYDRKKRPTWLSCTTNLYKDLSTAAALS